MSRPKFVASRDDAMLKCKRLRPRPQSTGRSLAAKTHAWRRGLIQQGRKQGWEPRFLGEGVALIIRHDLAITTAATFPVRAIVDMCNSLAALDADTLYRAAAAEGEER